MKESDEVPWVQGEGELAIQVELEEKGHKRHKTGRGKDLAITSLRNLLKKENVKWHHRTFETFITVFVVSLREENPVLRSYEYFFCQLRCLA